MRLGSRQGPPYNSTSDRCRHLRAHLSPRERLSLREAIVAIVVFVLVGSFRFLALTGFPDDHYVSLAGAQQMLYGAWPSRDFVDLGAPLTYAVSAAAQAVIGRGQYAEAVLLAVAFATAAVITLRAAVALTGSILLGLAAVAIEVLVFPRTYSYPKLLLYSAAALLLTRYAQRPTTARLVGLAVFSVTALLVRHDHGLFIGLASLAAVTLAPPASQGRLRAGGLFSACVVALATPYLVYLQSTGGVVEHLGRALTFARLEVPRQSLNWSRMSPASAWLLGTAWVVPAVALAVVTWRRIRDAEGGSSHFAIVAPLTVLALVADWGMIRDSLPVRLPDAMILPPLLLAWLVSQAWSAPGGAQTWILGTTSAAVLAATVAAGSVMGATAEQLDRVGVFSKPELLLQRFGERTRELKRPWVGRQAPSAAAVRMAPFFDYVSRCVPDDEKLLVPGFLPEIPVLARRAFAGGQVWFMSGTMTSAADHRLVMQRLGRERVPLAVVRRPNYTELAREFRELDAYVARFEPVATWSLGGDDTITLAADKSLARGTDAETGWPCFK